MSTGRCDSCAELSECPQCGEKIESFRHIGVRASNLEGSSIWHYAKPCGHRVDIASKPEKQSGKDLAGYKGGPLWQDGYKWINVFWGSYWEGNPWIQRLDKAVEDIETDKSYSGGLSQYNVGMGEYSSHVIIKNDPPSLVSDSEIGNQINTWVSDSTLPDLNGKGAYNIFLPPGVSASLGKDRSCVQFCDYHDTANGKSGPFFTVEPYPCSQGCNQCNGNPFDTLTQGLSEEMTELKTDMDPGTGWVIGNEEVCDYCDKHFVCNRISEGEYVNAWYSNEKGACWTP